MSPIRIIADEIRRRRVLPTVAVYIVAAWVTIQVADVAIDAGVIDLPLRSVFVAAFVGFPIALIASWFYDVTRHGIVRTPPVDADSAFDTAPRIKDYGALAALVLVWGAAVLVVHAPVPPDRSIAILPFENRGHDPEGADLAFGIRLDLQTQLSVLRDVTVIGQASADRVDTALPVPVIARKLGVSFLLKATVERVVDRVRVSVILIDAEDDAQVFSKSYDRYITATDLFDIRADVAAAIVSNLQATLSPGQSERLASRPTENLVAFQKYALGMQQTKRRTLDSLAEATRYFREAAELDPGFAAAYAGLADSIRLQALYSGAPIETMLAEVNMAIERALALDNELGEAWASRAAVQRATVGAEAALQSLERALELSPNHATARHWYGDTLVSVGRVEAGLTQMREAQRLDPLSPIITQELGSTLFDLGRFDEALAHFQTAVEIDPKSPGPYERVADMQRMVFGRLDEAVTWQLKAIALDPAEPMGSIFLGFMYLDLDDVDEAERWFDRADRVAPPGFWLARAMREAIHLRRGETEKSVDVARETLSFHSKAEFTLSNLKSVDIRAGKAELSRARYASAYPELFQRDARTLDGSNIGPAIDLASVLMALGDETQAFDLLDEALRIVQEERSPLPGSHDIAEVRIHALRGNRKEALAALDAAIDKGWRANWWFFMEHDSNLDALRDEPEFLNHLETVKADMAMQLARVREWQLAGELPEIPFPD
jgi:tetratricopeptide (TPR) repeat protein